MKSVELPERLFAFIREVTLREQIIVTGISVAVFAMSFVPLELQRQIVNTAIKASDFDQLGLLSLGYGAIVLLQGGTKFTMNVLRGRITENAMRNIRLRVRERMQGPENGQDSSGPTVSLVASEVEPLGGFIGESISAPLVHAGSLVTILAYLSWVEPVMAAVGVALLLPQFFFVPPLQRAINAKAKERIETLRDIGDVIVGSEEAKCGPFDESRFACLVSRIFEQRMSIYYLKFFMKFLINLLNHLGAIGVLFVGGWFVLEGRAEVGTIVAFLSGISQIGDPGRMLVAYFRQLTDAQVRYRLIRRFFIEV